MKLKLYDYWRSSCSWRVRMALAHKGIAYESVSVPLLEKAQYAASHLERNPMGKVPTLEWTDDHGKIKYLSESLAIIEWLDETFPKNPLYPKGPWQKALTRGLALTIACGIHPLQNLSVMQYVSEDQNKRQEWSHHWIQTGFQALEKMLLKTAGRFCMGNELTMADCCLAPQVYNANRFDVDMKVFPTITKINENILKTEAGQKSHPDRFKSE